MNPGAVSTRIGARRRAVQAAFGNAKVAGRDELGTQDADILHGGRRQRIGFWARLLYRRCSTQALTEPSAAANFAGSVPPACAMSARPPPFPPTCWAT